MLPLGDLIRDLDVRVVAGESGLENAVRWVHISALEDPTPWLAGRGPRLTTGNGAGGVGRRAAARGGHGARGPRAPARLRPPPGRTRAGRPRAGHGLRPRRD